MATLEKRGNQYRIVFWTSSRRFSRSLRTTSERAALASLARFEDNLRRYDLGLLTPPDGADIATFLLSDGNAAGRPSLPSLQTLEQLCDKYFDSLPIGSLEQGTISGMRIHVAHLKRKLGATFPIHSLEPRICRATSRNARRTKATTAATSAPPPSKKTSSRSARFGIRRSTWASSSGRSRIAV